MGQLKKLIMATVDDDMFDCIAKIALIDRVIGEGYDLDEVAPPEGFSEGCGE